MKILALIILGILILFVAIPQFIVFIAYMIAGIYYKKWKQNHKGESEK